VNSLHSEWRALSNAGICPVTDAAGSCSVAATPLNEPRFHELEATGVMGRRTDPILRPIRY
jgi:hypothetical protein